LNYRSQQQSKDHVAFQRVFKTLQKLNATDDLCWITMSYITPKRPKYMREKTYQKLLVKLSKDQNIYFHYLELELLGLAALLG